MSTRRRFVSAAATAALSFAAGPVDPGIAIAEKEWAAATKKADAAALGKLLADDLTYTHSTGSTDTKKQFIDNLVSGAAKYEVIDYEQMSSRMYGKNTAVLNARVKLVTVSKGNRGNAHLEFTHVWIKQGGRWQLAAHQSTRLPN
jgi:uncharacterized protein (TIGR02246 family)